MLELKMITCLDTGRGEKRLLVVVSLLFYLAWGLFSPAVRAQSSQATTTCPEGRYLGKQSGRSLYGRDDYVWAVSRSFAKRFCMPEEFIADDLKGAEALAYRYKRSPQEFCEVKGGQEICGIGTRSHWLEIYVDSNANIPKYDREVKFYTREFSSSSDLIGERSKATILEKIAKQNAARKRGEIVEPAGQRSPFRGFTPEAHDKHTAFHYLARISNVQVEERSTAFEPYYYQANIHEGIDLIALDGWSSGNIALPRSSPPALGFSLGVAVGPIDAIRLKHPDEFLHVIEMPNRITRVMHAADEGGGQAFESAVRDTINSMLRSKQAAPIVPNK